MDEPRIQSEYLSKYPKIVLFDGICNLCAASVKFIIRYDKQTKFHFAALQSEIGQQLQGYFQLDAKTVSTVILIENQHVYTQSTAALRIAKNLDKVWPLLYVTLVIPRFIRDYLYKWIAQNRYKWFGQQESCMMPTKEIQSRFID